MVRFLGLPFVFLGMGPMFPGTPKLFLGTLERFLGMPIPQLGGQIEQRTFPAGDWPLGDKAWRANRRTWTFPQGTGP